MLRLSSALFCSLLALMPATGSRAASVLVRGEAGIGNGPTLPPTDAVDLSDPIQVSGRAQIYDGLSGGGAYAASQFIGASGFGILGSLAGAEAEVGANGYAQGYAQWNDLLVITPSDPSLLFTPGTLSFSASVGGAGGVQLTGASAASVWFGSASYNAWISFDIFGCAACIFSASGDWYANDENPGGVFTGDGTSALISGTVDITFGIPVPMQGSLFTYASATGGDAGRTEAFASYLSTLLWQGISEVRDQDGALVAAYTVTSESTTDWSQAAVPEASTALLLGLGLAPLALVRRQRPAAQDVESH
jgi:hypothetical protein